jgi:hypothetical protein
MPPDPARGGAAGGTAPRLGELLVRKGYLTPAQVSLALSEQQTEIRFCPVCQIRVNVAIRGDAVFYRCSRCQGALVTPEAAPQVDVVDDCIIVVSREPLPLEVRLAAHIPDRRFGKYILLRELGAGGAGRVDLAWDTYLSQYVALKRLRGSMARGDAPDEGRRHGQPAQGGAELHPSPPPEHRHGLRRGADQQRVLHRDGIPGRPYAPGEERRGPRHEKPAYFFENPSGA